MTARQRAEDLLVFYVRHAWEAAGLEFSGDNLTEVRSVVGAVLDAAAEDVRELRETIALLAARVTELARLARPADYMPCEDCGSGPGDLHEECAGTGPQCGGCVGRGTGTACCLCGLPIPPGLRRQPGDPSELTAARPSGPDAEAADDELFWHDSSSRARPRPQLDDEGGASEIRAAWWGGEPW